MTQIFASDAFVARQYLERGIAHFKANRFAHALSAFDKALALNPDDSYARYNRATALLSIGDYERGFVAYEAAWRLFHWRGFGPVGNDIDRLTHLPLWRGERGVRLLAYHEMGYGDAIMAMRWLPEIKRRTEAVLVIAQPLVRLARSFGIEVTDQLPDSLMGFDFRLPFFGVMGALHQTADSIPAEPYILTSDNRKSDRRIGIAWSGRTQTAFSPELFCSMLAHGGHTLHALQPGDGGDQIEPLDAACDFADVAERMREMDHIVSVDTAAIHLAGAMGHPSAHLLLPYLSDWRWHHTARWYPRLKTYRQQAADDWSLPFKHINEALHGTA